MEFEITVRQHPEIGFGWWWEVESIETFPAYPEAEWMIPVQDSGYSFTKYGASWAARRACHRITKSIKCQTTDKTVYNYSTEK